MFDLIIWDTDDDPVGNVRHIAEHGLTPDEVEVVLRNPRNDTAICRSSGEFITFGYTDTGRYIAVVWEEANEDPRIAYPITAYEVPQRRG